MLWTEGNLYSDRRVILFREREGLFIQPQDYSTQKEIKKTLFPHRQVDKGAIKFVLKGVDITCLHLASRGTKFCSAAADRIVAIEAEGKQLALGTAVMKMSADDAEKVNTATGIETRII